MTAPAIIQGQLVDVRNVHTHKSVLLSVHVPVEYAQHVTAAFGWPSMVSPVPVAVAGLERPVEAQSPSPHQEPEKPAGETLKPKGGKLARQAGMACGDKRFWRFLEEKRGVPMAHADHAAEEVCAICGIVSRRELDHYPQAAERWDDLYSQYVCWRDAP